MTFAGGVTPHLNDDFCHYASLYREGMNSNSAFYRFLCFYKIIESIPARRRRTAEAAKQAGEEVRRFREVMPVNRDEVIALLKEVYSWEVVGGGVALDWIVGADSEGVECYC